MSDHRAPNPPRTPGRSMPALVGDAEATSALSAHERQLVAAAARRSGHGPASHQHPRRTAGTSTTGNAMQATGNPPRTAGPSYTLTEQLEAERRIVAAASRRTVRLAVAPARQQLVADARDTHDPRVAFEALNAMLAAERRRRQTTRTAPTAPAGPSASPNLEALLAPMLHNRVKASPAFTAYVEARRAAHTLHGNVAGQWLDEILGAVDVLTAAARPGEALPEVAARLTGKPASVPSGKAGDTGKPRRRVDLNRLRVRVMTREQRGEYVRELACRIGRPVDDAQAGNSPARRQNGATAIGHVFSAAAFADPHLPGPTALTIRADGSVVGHLALFGEFPLSSGPPVRAPLGVGVRVVPPVRGAHRRRPARGGFAVRRAAPRARRAHPAGAVRLSGRRVPRGRRCPRR